MRTVLLLLLISGFQNVFGQLNSTDYEIFSDVLSQNEGNRSKEFLVSDSTTSYTIELSSVESYLRHRTDKNLKLVKDIFAYHDLFIEILADSSFYHLLVAHNLSNQKLYPITQKFRKKLLVDIVDRKKIENTDFWNSLHEHYPNSGGI